MRSVGDNLPIGTVIDDIRFPDLVAVAEDDVFTHVVEHGFPTRVVAVRDDARHADDTLCLVPEPDGRWRVYYMEGGQRRDEAVVESYAAGQRLIVAKLYDAARTALNHRWWHAHPEDRPRRITDMP